MKKMNLALMIFLAFTIWFGSSGCHTYVWQNIDKKIAGVWTRMPVEPGYIEIWNFDNGKLSITVNGVALIFQKDDGTTTTTLNYTITNTIDNHYLYFDNLKATNAQWSLQEDIERWLIITLNNSELYLSAETKKHQKGGTQKEFYRL